MEWLSASTPAEIARIGADLAGSELHVVFTVRDLARTVPAAWQECAQNGATWCWREFLEQVTADDPGATPAGGGFWRQQDVTGILERWLDLSPPECTHVVTVPPAGGDPAELWRRLATVIGVEARAYDLASVRSNASLGWESAEVMRRVNEQVRERKVGRRTYERAFKHHLAKRVLSSRKSEESRVLLPAEFHDWAREQAERQIDAIKLSGVDVVGSLEELRPELDPSGEHFAEPEMSSVLDAAVDALTTVALARQQLRDEHAAHIRRIQDDLEACSRANDELRLQIERRASRPVRQALIDISARHPALLVPARAGYRKAAGTARRLRRST